MYLTSKEVTRKSGILKDMKNAVKVFDRDKSLLRDIYHTFLVKDPGELESLYMRHDQKLMQEGMWDYKNKDLLPNKIKEGIESVSLPTLLDSKEKLWLSRILWLWYHHAISCALWKYGDTGMARFFAKKALFLQEDNHPNRVTYLLYLLTRGEYDLAEYYAIYANISKIEIPTIQQILNKYREGSFFRKE